MTTLILLFFAGIANAIMDKLQFHYEMSRFANFKNEQFWNPKISWVNKWKNSDKSQGEAFFLSSTVLVFLTDAWHLFQFIWIKLVFIAILVYSPMINWWADFILFNIVYSGTFELTWRKL